MKAIVALALGGIMVAGSGCVTMLDDKEFARQQADFESLRTDMDVLKEKLSVIQTEQQALARDIEAIRKQPREDAAARAKMEQLEQQLRAVNAARESDRRQVVDEISRKVAGIVGASGGSSSGSRATSGRSSSSSETGYEHVVKSGETLSAIAQAYKVNVTAIMRANNMKAGDKLRVGQKLFVPAQ